MKRIIVAILICTIIQIPLRAGNRHFKKPLFISPPITELKHLHADQNLFFNVLPIDLLAPISEFMRIKEWIRK